ncbi:unnamed protein product [Rotaria sp. Silwood1]|nr:unnamed protein product [Rotaria sp. Silwood1]CAF1614855.1 unnamed protein product [Rotaria sp. Silwood1]CAF3691712.1 unnamed protein product [Rotaria sp. Silwood1]CAF3731422.1 unnamed protein product [Rotaria sp. Silwood1]CAF3751742.1 unnamed protein product [Rotaria sp. Silwood1]
MRGYKTMTWSKRGVSFVAHTSSVVLLMISEAEKGDGNLLAIDDIKVRVCSINHSGFCPPENSLSSSFKPDACENRTMIGFNCNTPNSLCKMLKPCQNNGTCYDTETEIPSYHCSCPSDFNGTDCEFNCRPCKPYTCLDHGLCNETSNSTFNCICDAGWQGAHCESMINFCDNVTCFNRGVCRPLLLSYKCECLGNSYSGVHCQITSKKIIIYKIVTKSFAYIAIIAISLVAMFVITMDILKYCFGIDLTREELERYRREKRIKKRKLLMIQ